MRAGHLAFLLHMHQPDYVDPTTGRAELPWVRLHGARGYLDVARLLDEYPHVRLTVNFVPSLVAQLEEVVAGKKDAWVQIAEKPTGELTQEERQFLVARFFSIHWQRAIESRPRYRELLEKRGREASSDELRRRAADFTDAELRDLTVLFFLSWIGFAAREDDSALAQLEERGRDFSLEDLRLVLERQRSACARVLPLYAKLAARGQIELSASPYYHPIIPLLIESDSARRAQPSLPLPDTFAFPDDARLQIEKGAEAHARTFGQRPVGMWPPEGSVSPEAVAAYAEAQIRWLATDEGNLWRSRERAALGATRGDLYRAYRHGGVDLLFRDRELSDRIGFSYAHGEAEPAVHDLLGRVGEAINQSTATATNGGDEIPVVSIFLDGENPWESYPKSGELFLRSLFAALREHPQVRSTTIAEHLASTSARIELPFLHSGSWIDSDFHVWIGDPVKNRAWELLGRARRRLDHAADKVLAPAQIEAARAHLLAAEGSDWFWWFGAPFSSAEDELFDRTFRAHLAGAYQALGEEVPADCLRPVFGDGLAAQPAGAHSPVALIHPRISGDGSRGHYYAWQGAGKYDVPRGAAMADSPFLERIYFGFDLEQLFLRLDPLKERAQELSSATVEVELVTDARRLFLAILPSGSVVRRWELFEEIDDTRKAIGSGDSAAFKRSLELSVPFAKLGFMPRQRVQLAMRLLQDGLAIARYPADGQFVLHVPDASFEAENWTV
jgi:alpha-amylase/alpha-mannosidase (GH57 family)